MAGGQRVPAAPGRPRADRARGLPGHRVRVGGRAPLPRGVLAQQRPRGVPGRRFAADEAHPPRPRDRPDARPLQPPGPGGGAGLDARPGLERPRGLRHRRVVLRGRARRVPGRPDREARAVGGGAPGGPAVHDRDAVHRPSRQVGDDAAPQRRAQAAPEAASAGVGGVQPPRHDPPRGPEGDRRARVRVRGPRRGAPVGRRLPRDARDRRRPDRGCRQRAGRVRHDLHVRPRRGHRARRVASRARTSSGTRSRTTTCSAAMPPA